MGICTSKEERQRREKSDRIDKSIIAEKAKMMKDGHEIKILLLGTGESGKSTIVKQMKIIHMNGYTKDELLACKIVVFRNAIRSMQGVIQSMLKLQVEFTDPTAEAYVNKILDINDEMISAKRLGSDVRDAIWYLWTKCGIQNVFDRLSQINYVIESAPYFFDNIKRIGESNYVPTVEDVLRMRIKTTSISETKFTMGADNICMWDVGGQRSERKKWIHCFEDVTSVIFCVALSEYDQKLAEESKMNRMVESFKLFEDIVNSKWFTHASIILFLNKMDLFEKKLHTSPLEDYFEDYKGGTDFEKATAFIQNRFVSLNYRKALLYPHLTCATDTTQINLVFAAVKETILANAFLKAGMV